ncbi:hypothetical protein D3C80_1449860 [compost metagenome]
MLHLKTLRIKALLLLLVVSHYSFAADKTTDWPLTIDGKSITAIIYQPQPETLTGSLLKGRATNGNWQTRDGNQWKNVGSGGPRVTQPSTTLSQRQQQNYVPQDVQRQSINRDRVKIGYDNYNRSVIPQGGSMNRGGGPALPEGFKTKFIVHLLYF